MSTVPRPETTPPVRHKPCPLDTNGDGDCGRQACPFCSRYRSASPRSGEIDRAVQGMVVQQVLSDHERAVLALVAERDSLSKALGEALVQIDDKEDQRASWERWGYDWKARAEGFQRERDELRAALDRAKAPFIPILAALNHKVPNPRSGSLPWMKRCPRCAHESWTLTGYRDHFMTAHPVESAK